MRKIFFYFLLRCVVVGSLIVSPLVQTVAIAKKTERDEEEKILASEADAFRFLEQSSFGVSAASLARVQAIGFDAFLQEQFNAPMSGYPSMPEYPEEPPANCTYLCNPDSACYRCWTENYTMFPLQRRFFDNALRRDDQLRQRIAWTLSQILVVSANSGFQPHAMSEYQQLLTRHAFGNYRQILYDVSLSPLMGTYLDMVDNEKPDPDNGYAPNENYARELLQLFSIGLYRLNQDGTPQIQNGQRVPTYGQTEIEGFANALTGWTYAPRPGQRMMPHNPPHYLRPMRAWEASHDRNAKTLLGGAVLPANQTAAEDLEDAIDNIFNHPNVAPFVCTRLIQHLVTSNPTPAYVGRCSAAFNNNGSGVRGDMRAIVRAILLDPEARGDSSPNPNFGKLREPVLYTVGLMRFFNVQQTELDWLIYFTLGMKQYVFHPPSVFNYYPPTHKLRGTELLAPEFVIQTSQSTLNRINFALYLLIGGIPNTTIDLTEYAGVAADSNALVELVNRRLMHGAMSQAHKDSVIRAVNAVPSDNPTYRAMTALYLVAVSSQYQVQR